MREFVPDPIEVKTIQDLISLHDSLYEESTDKWMFRGEGFRRTSEQPWLLRPSLERVVTRFGRLHQADAVEDDLLREFQRRYHHYSPSCPERWNTLEWFALMQHHGAPTRLLDWTYSPLVAAFFALLQAMDNTAEDREAVIWCCNLTLLTERALGLLRKSIRLPRVDDPLKQDGTRKAAEVFDKVCRPHASKKPRKAIPFVYPVNSFRLNERLTIQQGVFLAPGDVTRKFHENVEAMDRIDGLRKTWKLWRLSLGEHSAMLRKLTRMNLTEAALFPGLDGFSRSLKLHWTFLGP